MPTISYAQNFSPDIAKKKLQTEELSDGERAKIYLQITEEYQKQKLTDSVIMYAQKCLEWANSDPKSYEWLSAQYLLGKIYVNQKNYPLASSYFNSIEDKGNLSDSARTYILAEVYNFRGVITSFFGNYDSATYFFQRSVQLFEKANDPKGVQRSLTNLGRMEMALGNYPAAINYFFKTTESLDHKDVMTTAINHLNIGQCYVFMKEYEKAKKYLFLSLNGFALDGTSTLGLRYSNEAIGEFYSLTNLPDSSIFYLNESIRISEKSMDAEGVASSKCAMGATYLQQKNWAKAFSNASEAYAYYAVKNNLHRRSVQSHSILAESALRLGRNTEALKYAIEGLAKSRTIKSKENEKELLRLLAEIYAVKADYKSAYTTQLEYFEVNEELLGQEKTKQIAQMEAQYKTKQAEQELLISRFEQKVINEKLAQQEYRQFILLVGLFAVLVALALGAFFYSLLRRSKRKLDIQHAELQSLNKIKDRFFTIVGHDLKGPITSFSGVQTLINWYIDQQDFKRLKALGGNISQMAHQLDTLLNNLLNWATSQSAGIPYHPESINLYTVVKEVSQLYEGMFEAKRIKYTIDIADATEVYADKNALMLVLRNLISNAMKFTSAEGEISVVSRLEGGESIVEVIDTGVGIAPDQLKDIFSLETGLSTAGTANEKGTGLGLILCREYTELNRGKLKIKSEVGKGSTFTFTIPSVIEQKLSA